MPRPRRRGTAPSASPKSVAPPFPSLLPKLCRLKLWFDATRLIARTSFRVLYVDGVTS